MSKRWWVTLVLILLTVALYRNRLRAYLEQASANVCAFDLPTAGMYDTLVASVLGGFYARVAAEAAVAFPRGRVLEVGSGPGRLAVRLAQEAPDVAVTGVDISDAMVERAAQRAAEAGLSGRVRFEVGDVGALPFSDGEFEGAVSTLSLHHWPDPSRGLVEVHRILKPGGEAWIYDLAHWLWRPAHGESRISRLAAVSPFDDWEVEVLRWPGPVPAFVLLRLRRAREGEP
jgi:SAM-dependent methyltransferase